jgi:hypothetical protein
VSNRHAPDAEHGGSAPTRTGPSPTCADATQKNTDRFAQSSLKIGSKLADVKGVKAIQKGIALKKLPSGTYKISVVATTILKQRLTGNQTYKPAPKAPAKSSSKAARNTTEARGRPRAGPAE